MREFSRDCAVGTMQSHRRTFAPPRANARSGTQSVGGHCNALPRCRRRWLSTTENSLLTRLLHASSVSTIIAHPTLHAGARFTTKQHSPCLPNTRSRRLGRSRLGCFCQRPGPAQTPTSTGPWCRHLAARVHRELLTLPCQHAQPPPARSRRPPTPLLCRCAPPNPHLLRPLSAAPARRTDLPTDRPSCAHRHAQSHGPRLLRCQAARPPTPSAPRCHTQAAAAPRATPPRGASPGATGATSS